MSFAEFKLLYIVITFGSIILIKAIYPLDKKWKIYSFILLLFTNILFLCTIISLLLILTNDQMIKWSI